MEILVGKSPPVFETGQHVLGVLRVATNNELNPLELKVSLVGSAELDWLEQPRKVYGLHATALMDPDMQFQRNHTYINLSKIIIGQNLANFYKNLGDIVEIPFEFKLPDDGIPSSFSESGAKIEYKIVSILKNFNGIEHKTELAIEVLAPIRDRLFVPVANSIGKHFGVMSLVSGQINIHASLIKRGYFPGEIIEVHCEVDNDSSVEVTPRATLCKTWVYMCGERHKAWQSPLEEPLVGKSVAKHSNDLQLLRIRVPFGPLTIKSDLIAVKYFIHLTLDIPHAFDMHINLPIVVTTQSALKHKD